MLRVRVDPSQDLAGATSTKTPPLMQAPRSRLLLSCGESVLAVARKAYQRVETMGCPVGCLARGVSRVVAPVLSPLQLRCLSALSFLDRQLLVAQDVATVLFPASERVLSKADELVLLVESLPARLDGLEALVAGVKSGAMGFFILPKRRCRAEEPGDDAFRDIRCDEEEDALHPATAEVERTCEDVARKLESVEEVVPADGSGVVQGGEYGKEPEASAEFTAETLIRRESRRGANPAERDDASGGAVEDAEETVEETRVLEIVEIVKAETEELAASHSYEGGSSEREEEAISMSGRRSTEDDLLYLFDEAWQMKLA